MGCYKAVSRVVGVLLTALLSVFSNSFLLGYIAIGVITKFFGVLACAVAFCFGSAD